LATICEEDGQGAKAQLFEIKADKGDMTVVQNDNTQMKQEICRFRLASTGYKFKTYMLKTLAPKTVLSDTICPKKKIYEEGLSIRSRFIDFFKSKVS
jgi:hypothetical protein